jgi:hypothetical protein
LKLSTNLSTSATGEALHLASMFPGEESAGGSAYTPQQPTPRQKLFLDLESEREVFYGGAAGGGKSSCLLMAALRYVEVPNYSALLLRRTYQDLSKPGALMDRAHEWLRGSGASWNEQKKQWTFPSGAKLTFGYLETENDKYQYQGAEYQLVGFDELTQFTETSYKYLFSRLRRLSDSDVPIRMRSASNPGGVGGEWVHERFIPDDFSPEQAREHRVFWKEGSDEEGKSYRRAFVPARLDDNPHLDRVEYAQSLEELDPVTREQLLRGDWHIRQRGNVLSMWDERAHVLSWKQFAVLYGTPHIPMTWLLGVYQDWGTTPEHPCVTSWFATAPQNSPLAGSVFLYRAFVTYDATVREVAGEINRLMAPRGEKSRTKNWQMSHEASSERIAYNREHGLPFVAWKTGKTRGIAQLQNALELVETDRPHPFNPSVMGRPKLYHVVDDAELRYPKTDAGLVRHRAEAPSYSWATLKSGEPTVALVPHALFNDAMDTERAAAADYFPRSVPLTNDEKFEQEHPKLAVKQIEQDIEAGERSPNAFHAREVALRDWNETHNKPTFVSAVASRRYGGKK